MKSKDFAQILREIADLSRENHVRQGINELAEEFDQAGAFTVAGTLKRAGSGNAGGRSLATAPLLPFMSQVQSLLALAGKTAVAKDFNEVVRLIQKYPVVAFATTQAGRRLGTTRPPRTSPRPIGSELIDKYVSELTAALGNESLFAAIYSRLEEDPQMRPAELRELARKFSGAPGKSKSEALKKIWNRHQNLLVVHAKDRATAGRSAA